jgi:hypothetical protein
MMGFSIPSMFGTTEKFFSNWDFEVLGKTML